jgi:4-hydroxy-3-methylbut-2-enyl diphosphate reductase
VRTYGPLIHNPQALASLRQEGIEALDAGFSIAHNGIVIIRAHGIAPNEREALQKQAARVIDASCPHVLANQKQAARFSREGYVVVIAGDKKHAETLAVAGCAERGIIIESPREAQEFIELYSRGKSPPTRQPLSGLALPPLLRGLHPLKNPRAPLFMPDQKIALIAQTTISREEFTAIADALKAAFPRIVVRRTICPATLERQNALLDLCARADGVLVIGGKNSANTKRLFARAEELCAKMDFRARRAALIEDQSRIPQEFFFLDTVGLITGASTPDEVIDAVECALSQ